MMKKLLLAGVLCTFGFAAKLHAQVPNEGFEYWENAQADVPLNWKLQGKATKTAGKSGGFALKLQNNASTFDVSYARQIGYDSLSFYAPGFAFLGTPDSVTITFKPQLGMDTAYVELGFSKGADLIAYTELELFGNSGQWESKTFAVTYISGIPSLIADSGYVIITSADDIFGPYSSGSIEIDDIVFKKSDNSPLPTIPNNSFENWNAITVEYPGAWGTTSLLLLDQGNGLAQSAKSTDAHKGNFALELRGLIGPNSDKSGNDTFPGIAVTMRENSSVSNAGIFEPAFAVNARYTSIRGFIKSDMKANDVAMVWATFYHADSLVGSAVYMDGTSHSSYFEFSEDIAWNPNFTLTPDSANIALLVSDSNINQPNSMLSWARFDDLRFDNWSTRTQSPLLEVKSGIHPNPNNGNPSIKISSNQLSDWTLTVLNNQGQEVAHFNGMAEVGNNTFPLDLSHLSRGIYFTHFQMGNIQKTEKIILIP